MHDVRKLLPFYTVIFLGFFGYALTIALFIPMLMDQSFPLLAKDASLSLRTSVSGFLLAAYPLGQFLGSPIIGRLSDHHGRKKILLLSLWVCVVGFAGIALSIQYQSLSLLFLSCFITGLFESNMAISQAVIADQCQDSVRKTQLIGYAFSACSLGYIIGPLVGGLTAARWGYSSPFWFTTGGILLLIVWIHGSVKETAVFKQADALKLTEAMTAFKTILTVKNLRKIYLINFMIFFAVQGLYRVVPLYVEHQWAPNLQAFTGLISFVSLLCLVANMFMMKPLANRFETKLLLGYLLIFSGITALMVIIPSHYNWIWFFYGLMALPTVMLLTTCTTWLSNQVDHKQQGQVLGNNQALLVLGECLSAAAGGLIAAIAVPLPIIVMGGILLIAYWILKLKQWRDGFYKYFVLNQLYKPVWSNAMQKVGAFDAKTHFSELLSRVQRGESISITRRGVPVAILAPVESQPLGKRSDLLKAFYKWRKGIRWDEGMDTKTAMAEGRR